MSDKSCAKEAGIIIDERKAEKQDVKARRSRVLARLIEEVRNEKTEGPNAYNRMHNRHNRSR